MLLVNNPSDFEYLEIGLASPDRIRFWSHGEVEKPETINYRTFKPERKGLFCEKIFGPVKDWECSCGKYRRVRYRGIICERCGVEVTHSKVRRERMGHIELAADVAHIWFLKGIPSYLGLILDMSSRQLEEVIYYDSFIITDVDESLQGILKEKTIVSAMEYEKLRAEYGNQFKADIGASAIKTILMNLNLPKEIEQLKKELETTRNQKRLKITKRLRILDSIEKSGNRPEWMILETIPIMPPDLRPMVQLEGGRFATSDLNDLYRRVVNRNNRLKRLIDIGAPEMIIRNEKRMLQESVDVLISNGKRGRAVTGSNGRPLKSLGNIVEGKQGRFRQNLLGKRVDYSARSVIVVGPQLEFYQCGLPKEMALELFKPFIIRKLVEEGHVSNVKSAKRKIEKREIVVWDVLEKVIKGQPVLLNRAPTLHRLGIQAFEPILVEGSAIQIHPLVCTAFNADFDGDQMAVHVPLSIEAQAECRLIVMSTNNILAPSSGRSIVTPTQDMILGCYFLTVVNEAQKNNMKLFANIDEAWRAWKAGVINIQQIITVRVNKERYQTSMGRLIFNDTVWSILKKHNQNLTPFINETIGKKKLAKLVFDWFLKYGSDITVGLLDEIKTIGFRYATISGISISIDDLQIPTDKAKMLKAAENEVEKLEKLQIKGVISLEEKDYRKFEIWRDVTQQVSNALEKELGNFNNVYIMANSGARGNIDQVRQLAGMRGLMSDAQGRTVSVPIKTNFKEGLSLTEYFISSYGARKGLVDTALRTADSGYLTRRLVDVAQDVMITCEECGTQEGMELMAIKDGINVTVPLSEMIEGRVSLEDIVDPATKKKVICKGDVITISNAKKVDELGLEKIKVRSSYTCQAPKGICQKCYGLDLSTYKIINVGEAVGTIAAQSIGEPGTQLTMRTFHTGGVDLRKAARIEVTAQNDGIIESIQTDSISRIKDSQGKVDWIAINDTHINIKHAEKTKKYLIPKGSSVLVKEKAKVAAHTIIAQFDGIYEYVVAENEGVVDLSKIDIKKRKNEDGSVDFIAQNDSEIIVYDSTKKSTHTITKKYIDKYKIQDKVYLKDDLAQQLDLNTTHLITKISKGNSKTEFSVELTPAKSYPIVKDALLFVKNADKVKLGEIVARERITGSETSKTKDIVQGLPRVEELFEARTPKDPAILAEIDGVIEIVNEDNYRSIFVYNKIDNLTKEYKIGYGVQLRVYTGKQVKKGDQICEGIINPHDILATKGVYDTQVYLRDEIQRVYRSQGVQINTKHIEIIVRQMTRKLIIMDIGDSNFLPNELVDIRKYEQENKALAAAKKQGATGNRVLLGITRASLNTESFISAASFQQTASVLTKAATEGQRDPMFGLKENVIIGKLIPAGTGMSTYNSVGLKVLEPIEEIESEEEQKQTEDSEQVKELTS
jgi:DNA-directed RNA polymerase subunit beta'